MQEEAEDSFTNVKAPDAPIPDLVKFQDLVNYKLIDERVMRAITKDMKFEDMTEVQSKTLKTTLAGHDV